MGSWRAPLGGLAEGVHLCLGYKIPLPQGHCNGANGLIACCTMERPSSRQRLFAERKDFITAKPGDRRQCSDVSAHGLLSGIFILEAGSGGGAWK